jgi:hypothetical protein
VFVQPRAGGLCVVFAPASERSLVVGFARDLFRLRVAEQDEHLVIAGEGHTSSMDPSAPNNQS